MAKSTTTPTRESQTKVAAALIPKPTDERAEFFYLLGVIRGSNMPEVAVRLAELGIGLTAPTVAPVEGE